MNNVSLITKDQRLISLLFYVWVLSLPFYQASVVGSLSIDNIVGPIIFLLWLVLLPIGSVDAKRAQRLTVIIAILFAYFVISSFGFLMVGGTSLGLTGVVIQNAKLLLYLIVPIICVRDQRVFGVMLHLLVIDALIVCAAAIGQSFGLIDLGFSRSVAGNRLAEFEGVVRSPGLLGNYGDVAILLAFALVATRLGAEGSSRRFLGRRVVRYTIYGVLVLGVFAAQSRNVLLSMIVAWISCFFFLRIVRRQIKNPTFLFLILFSLLPAVLLIGYFVLPYLYSALLGEGGVRESVLQRFSQYEAAFSLLREYFWFGLGASDQYEILMAGLHNFWLGLALKGGMFAVGLVATLFYLILKNAISHMVGSSASHEAVPVATTALAMLVASMFYVAQESYIFWALMGVCLSLYTLGNVSAAGEAQSRVVQAQPNPQPRILRAKGFRP